MVKGQLLIQTQDLEKNKQIKKNKKNPKQSPLKEQLIPALQPQVQAQGIAQEQVQEEYTPKLSHLAICFPDSILELPQTSALRAYFISELARIASIFKVDEIVVLHDPNYTPKSDKFNPTEYLARNLQYLQTPQYLRKSLFKMHPDLNNVGLMNPIEARHHLKSDEPCEYREGVTVERPTKKGAGSWVDVGLKQQAKMDQLLPPFVRVTLRIKNYQDLQASFFEGEAISKKTPRLEQGIYWGYDVRIAQSTKELFKQHYDTTVLCHYNKLNVPQINHFQSIQLENKSILLFFTAAYQTQSLVSLKQQLCQYNIDSYGLGVKRLRMEEQLFYLLSKLVKYTT